MGGFDIKGEGIRRTTEGFFKEDYVVISMVVEHLLVQSSCCCLHCSESGLISLQPKDLQTNGAKFLVSRVVLRAEMCKFELKARNYPCSPGRLGLTLKVFLLGSRVEP